MDGRENGARAGATRKVDARTNPRARKRLKVRYGTDGADRTAFTKNLSESGLCLKTNGVLKPGTTIQVEIHAPKQTFSMWARVVWAKRVPPQLAHILDCGMGLRFLEPTPQWIEFCAQWRKARR